MSNSVTVTLTGDASQLEGVLSRVNGKVNNLASNTGKAGGVMGSLLGGLSNVAIGGALAGVGALTAGVAGLVSTLPGAAQSFNEGLASAGSVADGLGTTFSDARELVQGLQMDISRMAGSLPGATSNYADLAAQIQDTVAIASNGDRGFFRDMTKDITDSAGVLAQMANVDGSEAGMTLDRFISGNLTISGARQMSLFERNPRLLSLLEQGLGGRDAQDLTTEDRITLLNDALNRAIPEEALEEMKGSASSLFESLKTNRNCST